MKGSVLIIGSGVAGLSAARRLHQNGWQDVKILEARNYVGGRTDTLTYGPSGIELGAQWIHGQVGNAVYKLCKEHDLVQENATKFDLSISHFHQLKSPEEVKVAQDAKEVFQAILHSGNHSLGDVPKSDTSGSLGELLWQGFHTYMNKSKDSPEIRKLKEAVFDWHVRFEIHMNGCHSLHDVSASLLSNYLECDGNPVTELRNNYSGFVKLLRNSVPSDWILLNSEVKKIKWHSDGQRSAVDVTTVAGREFRADHVIVTVPLGYLKHNMHTMFEPHLPLKKQQAIQEMGFGTVDKIFMHFDEPFWKEGDIFYILWMDGKDYLGNAHLVSKTKEECLQTCSQQTAFKAENWARSLIYFTYVRNQAHLLCGWLAGDGAKAMEEASSEEVVKECHRVLCMALSNHHLPKPTRIMRSSWYSDPYFRGSYSYLSTGCQKKNVLPKDIADPVLGTRKGSKVYPFLLFAGEASHSNYFSTVHGAFETGIREADRLTEFYRGSDNEKRAPTFKGKSGRGGKVVIIGAGVAGLAAAQKLTVDFGFKDVLVLEAQDRIGGRIHTLPFGSGVLELGAQWVHGEEGNPLFCYAQDHDLLSDPREDYSLEGTGHFLAPDGQDLDRNLVEDVIMVLDSIKEEMNHHRNNTQSVGKYFWKRFHKYLASSRDSSLVSDLKQCLYDWYVRFEVIDNSCESLDCLSVDGFCEWVDCPGVPLINFKEGFHSLISCLAKDLPKKCIYTNTPVKCIEWRHNSGHFPATVRCENGQVFPADHVIVTSSIGFLKECWKTFFNPELPSSRKCALDSFGFGTVNKIYLIFQKPFWKEDDLGFQLIWTTNQLALNKLSEEHPWVRDISGFDTVRGQKAALVGWIGGRGAISVESVPENVLGSICTKLLKLFTGNQHIPLPVHIFRSKWHGNTYTRGAYSHRLNGYKQLETGLLSSPLYCKKEWPVLLFAGEATDNQFFSSVHGALRSGWREAERINHFWSQNSVNQVSSAKVKPRL